MRLEQWAWVAGIVALPIMFFTWLFKPEQFIGFCRKAWKLILSLVVVMTLIVGWLRGWFNWLSHPTTLPVWAIIVLLAALFFLVILLIAASLKKPMLHIETNQNTTREPETREAARAPQPDWHNFVSDEIFGVIWQWSYYGNTINDTTLAAFCPVPACMNRLELELDPRNPFCGRDPYVFPETMRCHRCGFKHHFDCDRQTLVRRVVDEIERLVNTRQYVARLQKGAK